MPIKISKAIARHFFLLFFSPYIAIVLEFFHGGIFAHTFLRKQRKSNSFRTLACETPHQQANMVIVTRKPTEITCLKWSVFWGNLMKLCIIPCVEYIDKLAVLLIQ